MKAFRTLTPFIIIFCLSHYLNAQDWVLSKQALDDYVSHYLQTEKSVLDWGEHSDTILFSALKHGDHLAVLGFRPIDETQHIAQISLQQLSQSSWSYTRESLTKTITDHYAGKYDLSYIFPFGINPNRPYIQCRILDYALIKKLKDIGIIRYLDPLNYQLGFVQAKSDSGCSPVNDPIGALDTISTTPDAVISWTNIEHNIIDGWAFSNKGDQINLAIIDTGLSPTQSKLNGDFTEGESGGRTLTKKGFYAPTAGGAYDGWEDQCGHGTAMSAIATAPKGFDRTPCGIAYKANLISYRATQDVIINTASEKDGVSEALYHAADTTVHIVSMSLGDIVSNGQVTDAVQYAEEQGVLIFAAAGTSTSFTNGFGVIFPATLNETVAVTGVKEGSAPFTSCNTCHDGTETDFVLEMERTTNAAQHVVSLGEPDLDISYVGGSSCATAALAGQAALIWSNNLTMTKAQVYDRLVRASNYFPNKNADHGWGAVDLKKALDVYPFYVCDDSLKYSVSMEITNISFPSTSDGVFNNTAEWVVEINGTTFYFEVPISGDSDNPAVFLNNDVCGYYPMVVDINTNDCGNDFLSITVSTHEDDGTASDCDYDGTFDDDLSITTETIFFNNTSFTHINPEGTFSFDYILHCTPLEIPQVTVSGDDMLCVDGSDGIVEITGNEGLAPYLVNYNVNAGAAQTTTTDIAGISLLSQSAVTAGPFLYSFDQIEDADGCIAQSDATYLVFVSPHDYAIGGYGPLIGSVSDAMDFETDGIIDAFQIIQPSGVVDYDSGVEINLLSGFEVQQGAEFLAFINGCDNGNGGLNAEEEIIEVSK